MCGIRLLTGLRSISDYRDRTLTCTWENNALSSVWTVPRAGTRNTLTDLRGAFQTMWGKLGAQGWGRPTVPDTQNRQIF